MKQGFAGLILAMLLVLSAAATTAKAQPNDQKALAGLTAGKALFDINVSDGEPAKLVLYLRVISETLKGLQSQNVAPEFIVAFRGHSVKLLTGGDGAVGTKESQAREKIASLIYDLQKNGVKFEVCSVATQLFKVDHSRLLPAAKPVGNTFISLIGYQAKGYALIPIM